MLALTIPRRHQSNLLADQYPSRVKQKKNKILDGSIKSGSMVLSKMSDNELTTLTKMAKEESTKLSDDELACRIMS